MLPNVYVWVVFPQLGHFCDNSLKATPFCPGPPPPLTPRHNDPPLLFSCLACSLRPFFRPHTLQYIPQKKSSNCKGGMRSTPSTPLAGGESRGNANSRDYADPIAKMPGFPGRPGFSLTAIGNPKFSTISSGLV